MSLTSRCPQLGRDTSPLPHHEIRCLLAATAQDGRCSLTSTLVSRPMWSPKSPQGDSCTIVPSRHMGWVTWNHAWQGCGASQFFNPAPLWLQHGKSGSTPGLAPGDTCDFYDISKTRTIFFCDLMLSLAKYLTKLLSALP